MKNVIKAALILIMTVNSSMASIDKAKTIFYSSKNNNELIVYELLKSGYYFSALPFARKHLQKNKHITSTFEKALEIMIIHTGIDSFIDMKSSSLAKFNSPSLNFILGMKYFRQHKLRTALVYLSKVPPNHVFEPETRMTEGAIRNQRDDYQEALIAYDNCIDSAKRIEDQKKTIKAKRYFVILQDTCLIHKARIEYKNGNFENSLDFYQDINKRSYKWPYILLEKAWINYIHQNYNRTLGLLVSYRSPLLNEYFFPEAEVLIALSYLKLCLWEDSLRVIDRFYQVYKPRSDELKNILKRHKRSDTYFLYLVTNGIKEEKEQHPYIVNLSTQISKQIKFNLNYLALKKAMKEKVKLASIKGKKFKRKLMNNISNIITNRKHILNHYIKKQMYHFINNIHKYSYEMFNIKLEIMSKKRDLIYENKKLISDRSRGSYSNVNRKPDQYFWDFRGEFWADELGDYSFGLKSNCKEVKAGDDL